MIHVTYLNQSGIRTTPPAYTINIVVMYSYKRIGSRYIVSIDNHTEIIGALSSFCNETRILSGAISGIGAVSEMTLRFFNPDTKAYEDKCFKEQMEIANLIGNISSLDDKVYLHIHVTAGRSDYSAVAGHLLSAVLNGAGEFVIEDFGGRLRRKFSPDLGLNIYDFRQ